MVCFQAGEEKARVWFLAAATILFLCRCWAPAPGLGSTPALGGRSCCLPRGIQSTEARLRDCTARVGEEDFFEETFLTVVCFIF